MESRSLRYFVAVARTLSITRAAEQLGMAQPPLSRCIQALERELGTKLFHRANGLRLTAAGQAMLEKAEPALTMLDAARASAITAGQAMRTRLPIGFVAVAGYDLLPRLTRSFRAEHPEVELQLACMTNDEQARALHSGRIELGIAWLPFEHSDHPQHVLRHDPLMVALPKGHPLARLRRLTRAQLRSEPLVLGCRHAGITRAILRATDHEGMDSEGSAVRRASDLAEAVDCVASGLGITLVPASLRHERIEYVEYRELEHPEMLVLGAVHRPAPSAAVRSFLACARLAVRPNESRPSQDRQRSRPLQVSEG